MKYFSFKILFDLSPKNKAILLLIGFIWLVTAGTLEIRFQYKKQEQTFHKNIDKLIQKNFLEQKRSEAILNALSEY